MRVTAFAVALRVYAVKAEDAKARVEIVELVHFMLFSVSFFILNLLNELK